MAASGLLTGEPVQNPPGVTFSPTRGLGTPVASSVRLLGLRVGDPDGGPPWGMRTLSTTRGLACVQVGRVFAGTLGVLGQDGVFSNDRRFHEKPPDVLTQTDCQQPDAVGHLFIAVSYQGMPASALDGGCIARPIPRLPTSAPARSQPPARPICPASDERIIYYGLLGPQGKSVTYADDSGRPVTIPTSGPDGAYLVVLRPDARHPARGQLVQTTSPASGLISVQYRDGSVCRIRSPRSIGGAKACPLVGYVPPRVTRIATTRLATPVRASFSTKPLVTPGTGPAAMRRHGSSPSPSAHASPPTRAPTTSSRSGPTTRGSASSAQCSPPSPATWPSAPSSTRPS